MICCRKSRFYYAILVSIDFSLFRPLKWLNSNCKILQQLPWSSWNFSPALLAEARILFLAYMGQESAGVLGRGYSQSVGLPLYSAHHRVGPVLKLKVVKQET